MTTSHNLIIPFLLGLTFCSCSKLQNRPDVSALHKRTGTAAVGADGTQKTGQAAKGSSGDSTKSPTGSPTSINSQKTPSTAATISANDICYKADAWSCAVEAVIVTEMNKLRNSPLKQDGQAAFVARDWSKKQADRGSIGHEGFGSERLKVLRAEFADTKINFFDAENVAMTGGGDDDPTAVGKAFVKMWYESEGHRKNMLANHRAIGVGVVEKGRDIYATQIFY